MHGIPMHRQFSNVSRSRCFVYFKGKKYCTMANCMLSGFIEHVGSMNSKTHFHHNHSYHN